MYSQPYNKTSRKDGRSDGQVVYDMALNLRPNDILSYDSLLTALQDGVEIKFNRNRIYGAVKAGNKKLLKERNRYLAVIRGKGYKLISAEEHLGVALAKKQTAQKHMQTGVEILEHTAFEELSPTHRAIHERQMMIMKGLYSQIKHHEQKFVETDNLIEKLRQQQETIEERLERLENR